MGLTVVRCRAGTLQGMAQFENAHLEELYPFRTAFSSMVQTEFTREKEELLMKWASLATKST